MTEKMRAVVWEGKPYHMSVQSQPIPSLSDPLDAIVRITTSAICGSDLHTYHGLFGSATPPWIMGHEAVGVVDAVGEGVKSIKVGDRVVVCAVASCGFCENCVKGDAAYCLTVNPPQEGAVFGEGPDYGPHMGGSQAEYVRVPFADSTCVPLPPGNDHEEDYVLIADIWCTAWWGLDAAGFKPGDSVAVFGAGPVGLLCAYSAMLRGARVVYSIDHLKQRLQKAESIGAVPINFTKVDVVQELMKREPRGVERSIDCVGLECVNAELKPQVNVVLNNCIQVTSTRGGIGGVGVYSPLTAPTKGAPNASVKDFSFPLRIGELWLKGISFQGGSVEIRHLMPILRDMIASGRAKPSFVISSEIGIEEVPDGYRRFSAHKETKVIIRFPNDDHHHRNHELEELGREGMRKTKANERSKRQRTSTEEDHEITPSQLRRFRLR